MSPEQLQNTAKISEENYNVLQNQILLSLAQRESLIKSWTASSSHLLPLAKTKEELDVEDANLFQNQSLYLGIGASIPSDFSVTGADRDNKSLRMKLLGPRNLAAKKVKVSREKTEKLPRDDSSDDDLGRSSLGRTKKQKLGGQTKRDYNVPQKEIPDNISKIRDINIISCTSQPSCSGQSEIGSNLVNSGLQLTENDFNQRRIPSQASLRNSPIRCSNLDQGVQIENSPLNNTKFTEPGISTYESKDPDGENLDEKKRRKKREKKKRQKLKAKISKKVI